MKKIVLDKVREDPFLYISFRFDYKDSSWCYSNFLSFSRSPIHGRSLTLYSSSWTILILHFLIIWATTWVFVPLDTLSNFLWIVVAKPALFKGLLYINVARKLAAGHLMQWQQLFLRYFLTSILPVHS